MGSKRIAAFLAVSVFFLGACAFGAEQGATASLRARRAAAKAAAENLGVAGPGSDLKAIASPKKTATTFTGFSAGSLPGEAGGTPSGDGAPPPGRVVLSGDPLEAPIGESHLGASLDRVFVMADHVGYNLVLRHRYIPSALDAPYSYSLMRGRQRIATLFFDRSLKLSRIE